MAESAVATVPDGTVGGSGTEATTVSAEQYKSLQAEYTKSRQELAELRKQGATKEPPKPSIAEETQGLLKKISPDDPAVPLLERLSGVLAEQEGQLANVNRGLNRFHRQDLDMKVAELKTRCATDGFKLDEKALRDTIAERNLPLYDENGNAFDLYDLAQALQPDEYVRSMKAKGVAEYLAAQNTVSKNAVPDSVGKTLGGVEPTPGDHTETKNWLHQTFPGVFKS
ncbi:MAG: hypothetical protein WC551_10640 [Patescibacteria group bacterium]|jgi:uncharacterized protein YxeA